MEWTKENTLKSFIKCKTRTKREKAIKFYESLGHEKSDILTMEGTSVFVAPNGIIIGTYLENPEGFKSINPFYKPRRKFPREMMVSDDGVCWYKKTVVAKCTKLHCVFIAISHPYRLEDEFQIRMRNWKYAKEID